MFVVGDSAFGVSFGCVYVRWQWPGTRGGGGGRRDCGGGWV